MTTYVIGAGASKEVNLPIGSELKKTIAQLLNIKFAEHGTKMVSGSPELFHILRTHTQNTSCPVKDVNLYLKAARCIHDAMPQAISIDNYIDTHCDNKEIEFCGKLAIVHSILAAERSSPLRIDNTNIYNKMNFEKTAHTWYNTFLQMITENCRVPSLEERLSKVKLVIFNYDRCVEHYLFNALINYYHISENDAATLMGKIEIYHPYGSVGPLPWQSRGSGIEYGATPHLDAILGLVAEIRTFTEGTSVSTSDITNIRSCLSNAKRLVFLGFAYHRLNMDLIMPITQPTGPMNNIGIFGTAFGMSASDIEHIRSDITCRANTHPDLVHLHKELTCSGLLNEYSRSLSHV